MTERCSICGRPQHHWLHKGEPPRVEAPKPKKTRKVRDPWIHNNWDRDTYDDPNDREQPTF